MTAMNEVITTLLSGYLLDARQESGGSNAVTRCCLKGNTQIQSGLCPNKAMQVSVNHVGFARHNLQIELGESLVISMSTTRIGMKLR